MTPGQSKIITAFIYILGNTCKFCFNDKIQFCHHTQLLITNQVGNIPTWHTERRPVAPRWRGEGDCNFNSIYVAVAAGAQSVTCVPIWSHTFHSLEQMSQYLQAVLADSPSFLLTKVSVPLGSTC